jgi:tetratricopeptide (TPR) repeat protein
VRGARLLRQGAPLLLIGLLLAGCAARVPNLAEHLPEADGLQVAPALELAAVPFHPQAEYQCGPAALATVLAWSGATVTVAELVERVYLPARQGSLQPELRATARHFDRLAYEPEPRLSALLGELAAGHPVLVLQNLGFGPWPRWHYAVVIGYDAVTETFILRSGMTQRLVVSTRRFLASWVRADAWSMVVLPAGTLPASADLPRYLRAAADLEATGSPAAAQQAWAAAAQRWPESPATWFGLGNVHYRLQDMQAARAAFEQALRVAPTHIASHHNLAQIHLQHGCLALAHRHLAAAERQLALLPGLAPSLQALRETLEGRHDHAAPAPSMCDPTAET